MIYLLFSVIILEMTTILLLLFRTPLRKLVIIGLDRLKRGRGPVIVTTVGGTILVLLTSTVSSIISIQQREVEPGSINPTDQVLLTRSLLDASLMGFILFLGLMMDRLHHYIRELRLLRKTMEAVKKNGRGGDEEEVGRLKGRVRELEAEVSGKAEEVKVAEGKAGALTKQAEGLLMEYDRLLEENQSLRAQLEGIGGGDGKKHM